MKFHEGMGEMELPEDLVKEVKERQKAHMADATVPDDIPQYYKDFLDTLTPEQRRELIILQARAMEKVGYEGDTHKYFIEEFQPEKYAKPLTIDSATVLKVARPRLVIGGALVGAGATVLTIMAAGVVNGGWLVALPLVALGAGIWLMLNPLGDTAV